jgi:uncharacterized protein YrrD
MLQSLKQIHGNKLGASDGEIGHVKDFYFDDKHWAVRYIVADTGSWIPGRLVLISPHAVGALPLLGKILPVKLTRKQIEDSPPIESHKPVSRQYEEEYYQYYGWPGYWEGGSVWGMGGFPILEQGVTPSSDKAHTKAAHQKHADVHLRSAEDVTGYQIQTGDDIVGEIADFMVDCESWVICHLVVNTGSRFSGKKVFLSPTQVNRISWDESKVFVNLGKEAILESPAYEDGLASTKHR